MALKLLLLAMLVVVLKVHLLVVLVPKVHLLVVLAAESSFRLLFPQWGGWAPDEPRNPNANAVAGAGTNSL